MPEREKVSDDWRYLNGSYLRGRTFEYRAYGPAEPGGDHDHCAFCWAKFLPYPAGEAQTEGWVTVWKEAYSPGRHDARRGKDGSLAVPVVGRAGNEAVQARWVCRKCFDDFRDVLDLKTK